MKVQIYKFIRYCSGVGRHAWYSTNVGIRRKPIQDLGTGKAATELKPLSKLDMETLENPQRTMANVELPIKMTINISWFKRIIKMLKRILNYIDSIDLGHPKTMPCNPNCLEDKKNK